MRPDTRVRAAVVAAGLADSFTMYYRFDGTEFDMKQDCNELIGGSPVELYEEYVKRSPICWADRILCPVLIEQGTDDWRVTPGQAFAMDRALTAAGKEHKLIVYEGGDHSLEKTAWFEDAIAWAERPPALSGRLHNMNLNEERKTHMKKLACLLLRL